MAAASGQESWGPTAKAIAAKVTGSVAPNHFELFNDSHKHAHHAAMRDSSNITESHFRLVIVSDAFAGKAQPARHRMIYSLLKDEMNATDGVHALQLTTKTPEEWARQQSA